MPVLTEIAEYLVSIAGVQIIILFVLFGLLVISYAIYRKVESLHARSYD